MVLIFDTAAGTVDTERIAASVTGRQRLEQLSGLTGEDLTREALAASLDCAPEEIKDVLRRRNDSDLAAVPI